MRGIRLFACLIVGFAALLLVTFTAAPSNAQRPGAPTITVTPASDSVTVTVQRGDTLGRIAARYGVTVSALAAANGITNLNLISVGQRLIVPSPGQIPATGTATITATATITPTPGATLIPSIASGIPFEIGGQVFSLSYPELMQQAGMTWAKSEIRWNVGDSAEIVRGAIEAARSRGFRILLTLVGNPAAFGDDFSIYASAYAAFLGEVAALNPDAIEVWEGQNTEAGWGVERVDPAAYVQLLTQSYAAVKRANPNVLVISGAPLSTDAYSGRCNVSGCGDDAYIAAMAAANAGASADCIGIHYTMGAVSPVQTVGDPRSNPTHYSRYLKTMINLYAGVFPNKPLCFTEIGYFSPDDYFIPPGYEWAAGITREVQSTYLYDAATVARSTGRIRLFIVYNVDANVFTPDDPQAGWAIIRPDGIYYPGVLFDPSMGACC